MAIFIVEDSAAVRERLVEMVSEAGGMCVVGEADNYRDAVAGILDTHPDVAILDIKLADERGSGIDVLVEAKRHLPGLRGIVLSNYATPQHVKASADAGASYFLDKSTEFDQIIGILKTLGEGGQAPAARHRS
ncbi:MAG: response regulator transcription factor [Betaproteobacteria bacterium]|nr:response regulator transcription factor [Betaproteobacteria bacterium]